MKKIKFPINGRKYEVELDNDFAIFVKEHLSKNNLSEEKNNDSVKLLNAYLSALKEKYDIQNELEQFIKDIPI
ncbi:MAG: hypothetical protein KAU90_10290 [Sulfurovaceae bacterium]|nr:hypothetical protein [Sulfurovaceae bacterium]